jgi:serine/threonine-protein kinase
MTINPFTFGNPIRDPVRFYGRREDIRQIVNRLRSSARESTSVVGERRIGKTSLLKYLDNTDVADGLGLSSIEYCMVYIDFQGLTDITPQRFWQRVLRKMEREICLPELVPAIQEIRNMGEFDLFDLEDLFELIAVEGLTTVLLLDEFEYVTQNPNFGSDFFGGLRALAIHQNLPMVTATRRELVDLCHSEEIKGSPFFNIFANVVLRPFSRVEVYEMLDGYLAQSDLVFSPQEKELVIGLGGGYPFFIQMAGNYVVEAKRKGLIGDPLLHEVYANFDSQSDSHFTYMWSHSSESEKITLLAVISLDRQKPSAKTTPNIVNLAATSMSPSWSSAACSSKIAHKKPTACFPPALSAGSQERFLQYLDRKSRKPACRSGWLRVVAKRWNRSAVSCLNSRRNTGPWSADWHSTSPWS